MLHRKISAHTALFKAKPIQGETLILGRKEFRVRRVGRINYQLVESFFA
jgi:hypothetical protein